MIFFSFLCYNIFDLIVWYNMSGGIFVPATVVHSYFANDVRDILPSNIKKMIDIDRVRMFGQSMDSFKFYNLISIFPGKKLRDFSVTFHKENTQDFFIDLIKYIKISGLSYDSDVCSFLAGCICHYVLDSTIHPYIYYKTGLFDKRFKSTYKYNNAHAFMETFLDNDMISRREDVSPYHFKIGKFCFSRAKFSPELVDVVDNVFYKTYNKKRMAKKYRKSLKQMRRFLVVFRRDPIGVKKFFYKLLDTFTTKRCFRFEAISYHCQLEDRHNYLNLDHSSWRNPILYNVTSNESFLDLYVKAIKTAKVLICASFDYINDKNIDLEKIFNNNSYITGLNCDEEFEFKYFEF